MPNLCGLPLEMPEKKMAALIYKGLMSMIIVS